MLFLTPFLNLVVSLIFSNTKYDISCKIVYNFITKQPSNYQKYIYSNLYSKEDRVETVCDKVNDYADNNIRAFVAISPIIYTMSTYYDYTAAGDGCCFVEDITDDFHNNEVISRLCCLDPQGNTDFQKWGSSKETGFVESELNDYYLPVASMKSTYSTFNTWFTESNNSYSFSFPLIEASLYEYMNLLQSLWADIDFGKDGITNLTTLFHDLQTIKKSAIYKSLVQYIRDRDILDVLFQQCLNTQTLRLSLSLFFNIYLTNKNIDIFYEAVHNNRIYEFIQATTIICQLLPLFPNQQHEYLQNLLLNTSVDICTEQSIKVLSKLLVLYINDIPESQPIPDSIRNSIKTVGEYIFR
ncbi:hypothetical protein WA158_005412 [Blastocystis sp. Blastoise]